MSVRVRNEEGEYVDVDVEIHSVEPGGRHCAPSVDWEVVGELPEGVTYGSVEDKVIQEVKHTDPAYGRY